MLVILFDIALFSWELFPSGIRSDVETARPIPTPTFRLRRAYPCVRLRQCKTVYLNPTLALSLKCNPKSNSKPYTLTTAKNLTTNLTLNVTVKSNTNPKSPTQASRTPGRKRSHVDLFTFTQSLLVISSVTECCHLAIGD